MRFPTFILTLLYSLSYSASAQTNWSWITPIDGGEFFNSITYFRSNFFAVGGAGIIRSSPDGAHWRSIPSFGKKGLTAISASDNLVVALGSSEAWRSDDGVNWKSAPVPRFAGPFGMVYGAGIFVGVGKGGQVVTSPEGINWEIVSAPGGPFFSGVAFGNGRFVAVGINVVQTSTDGKIWTPIELNFSMDMYAVTYGSAGFVAVGQPGTVANSLDGETWLTNSFPSSRQQWMNAITFDQEYIAVGQDASPLENHLFGSPVFHSTNGIDWKVEPSHAGTRLLGVAAGGNRAVALGAGGEIVSSVKGDYTDWKRQTRRLLPLAPLTCTVGQGLVVSAMNDFLVISSNANHLQIVRPGVASWQTNDFWSSLTFGNGLFVVLSNYGKVATSTDGYEWTERASFLESGGFQLIYVKDRFFARNDNALYSSIDGTAWEKFPLYRSISLHPSLVIYGNGQFIAPPFISTDGSNWTRWNYGGSVDSIAFGDGRFLTLSQYNELSYSTNAQAINWIRLATPSDGHWPASHSIGLQFVNDRFFAVSTAGKLISSKDGANWDEVASFGMSVRSLATDGVIWAASDDSGGLAVSRPGFSPKTLIETTGGFKLIESSSQTGSTYRLLKADMLEGPWAPLEIGQAGSGDPVYWQLETTEEKQFFQVLQE